MRIDLIQGSAEWLMWRAGGIGGSDSSCVMGENPWRSSYRLWQEKTLRVKGFSGNEASRRGQDLEPEARMHYNLTNASDMKPACFQNDEHEFLRCSMDGINDSETRGLEVKCSGEKVHNKVVATGEIPKYYYAQCQKAMLCVPSMMSVDYFSYNPDSHHKGVIVTVWRADDYIEALRLAEIEFWWYIVNDTPPPGAPEDYIVIEGTEFDVAMNDYLRAQRVLSDAKKQEKAFKLALLDLTDGENCMGGGGKITRCSRKGSIDVDKLYKDLDISEDVIESYRQEPSTYFKIAEVKNEN